MKTKFCILISGIDNLLGSDAIHLVERFKLKEYGGVKIGQRGKYWYGDFDTKINTERSLESLHDFTGLLTWFGLKKITYRIDTARIADTQVDFQLHMIRDEKYIEIPKPLYISG